MYASANQWDGVAKLRKGMEEKRVRQLLKCNLIEVDGVVCEFVAGDKSHLLMEKIILMLLATDAHLKFSWHDDDDDYDIDCDKINE